MGKHLDEKKLKKLTFLLGCTMVQVINNPKRVIPLGPALNLKLINKLSI